MKRYGKSPSKGQVYRDRPGAYAVILDGPRLLLTIEASEFGTDWLLPGGGIDPGECVQPALHREIREETGWRVKMVQRIGVYQSYRYMPEYDLHARKVCHIYLCRAIRCLSDPLEANHTPVWVPWDLGPELISNATDAHFIADHANSIAALARAA